MILVRAAGKVSEMVTPTASEGPALLTVSVYTRLVPATTGSVLSTLVIERSAEVVTVVDSVAVLFAKLESVAALRTTAVLLIVPAACPELTKTRILTCEFCAAARLGSVQIILLVT